MADDLTRIEGGGVFCRFCNAALTFNMMDRPADKCLCKRAQEARAVAAWPIWEDVQAERVRAHRKHGDTSMESMPGTDPTGRRLRILVEEVGEVAQEFNDAEHERRPVDLVALRKELIQVAAMAGAWADACTTHNGGWALRTTCQDCGGPYDEDVDAWGCCAPCLSAHFDGRNEGPDAESLTSPAAIEGPSFGSDNGGCPVAGCANPAQPREKWASCFYDGSPCQTTSAIGGTR